MILLLLDRLRTRAARLVIQIVLWILVTLPCFAQCTFQIASTLMGTAPAAGANYVITVTATASTCARTATSNNPDFLTVSFGSPGTGNGTVGFTVAPNTTFVQRTGSITVAGLNYSVTQAPACGFTLNPAVYQADQAGATSTFAVQASTTSCAWTATSGDPTIVTVTSGPAGTGNGTVGFKVSANPGQSPRSASITVGNTALTIYQPGAQACSYALSAGSAAFASSGGSGSFSVITTCAWTPSTSADWISVSPSAATTGNGVVSFLVTQNVSSAARSSTITVGNQAFNISQTGVACSVSVTPLAVSAAAAGTQDMLNVSAADGCGWTASTNATWITLQNTTGSGAGAVLYSIAPNTTAVARSATIVVSNQAIRVSQDAADCSGQVLTPDHADLPAGAGTFSLNVGTACSYTAVANSGWIKIVSGASGTGFSAVTYTVSANSSADARTGTISVGSQVFTIAQSGASCTLSVNPAMADLPGQGGSGSFNVSATASCRWQPVADAGWIHTTYASANGNGRVNYTADSSDQAQPRSGNITVNGQLFHLTQGARPAIQVTSAGVVNAASLAFGPVSPGEIITIFGDWFGPKTGVPGQLTPDQQGFTNTLAESTVLFDGAPAPLIYVSKTQISAIVPYGVMVPSTQMQVLYQGLRSDPIMLDVAAADPGLFTIDASGAGLGAILNQDTKVNSATNPAAKNSVISLFATGEGQTNPAGVDGKIARAPLPRPVLPVTVQIGGRDSVVLYAGAAPGLPAGVMQVNARIPAQTPTGIVPVTITVGGAISQAKVNVAVQ